MAPAAKKPPLKSSSSHNSAAGDAAGKTIEEMYQKKTQLEHILLRPDTYVGSVQKHTQPLWVYEGGAMVQRPVAYVPGLYKIFDEILGECRPLGALRRSQPYRARLSPQLSL